MRAALVTLALVLAAPAAASGLRLGNPAWLGTERIRVEVSWDYGWKADSASGSLDAAWVFARLRRDGETAWEALGLESATAAPGYAARVPADGAGVFLERQAPGTGPVESVGLILELASSVSGIVDLRLFAVEMVYIPEGAFHLGDGASVHTLAAWDGAPFEVTGEGALTAGPGGLDSSGLYAPAATIPAAWPKGHQAIYMMKHELSQAAYAAFLNTLDAGAQEARTDLDGVWAFDADGMYRNGIAVRDAAGGGQPAVFGVDGDRDGVFDEPEDGGDRAVNGLAWDDVTAWLDWAGLRPMTEFEFEKAARGPAAPLPGGFAWGTGAAADANTIADDGYPTEHATDPVPDGAGLASHGYDGPTGPLRCGFAAGSGTSRPAAGASPYGVLELSGNLWELAVNVSPGGMVFDGEHGDGALSDGFADVAGWPSAEGAGFRGGAWNSGIGPVGFYRDLAVSDRWYAGLAPDVRRFTTGARGVRTAP